jgi:apolipoprotein N-acyltransferase
MSDARGIQRRWGLGVTFGLLGLLIGGLGVGDFFVGKGGAGAVVLALGLVLIAAAVACFRWRYTRSAPLPPLTRAQWLGPIAAGLLAGLAFPLLFPIFGHREQFPSGVLELFAWVGLVPLCAAIDGLDPRRAFGLGVLGGMAFFNMTFWWVNVAMTTFGGIPNALSIPVLQMLVGWCALHWGLATWCASLLQRRFGLPMWLALPAPWAATELMRNYFMSGYPWANLGDATTRDLPFAQVAGLGGPYLIAFVLLLVNAILWDTARALRRRDRPLPWRGIAVATICVVGGHLYGVLRIRQIDAELQHAPRVKIAVVQGNIDQKIKSRHDSYVGFILKQYIPESEKADAEGAQLVIWPEAAFPGYFPPGVMELRRPELVAHTYSASLLLGVSTLDRTTARASNSAYWVRPDFTVAAQYDKHHLVPFGEYILWNLDRYLPIGALVADVGLFTPGETLPIWHLELAGTQVNVGMLICYDAIFPEITRDYASRDVNLLVNITNDAWYGWASAPFQFLRIVELRAIESGSSVARAANTGISGFIDPAGRITGQTELGLVQSEADEVDEVLHVPSTHLTREVPLLQSRPLYVHIGDAFAYLCALVSLVGAGMALFTRR